jgi:pimeloyl-ACP methyl ester carboxylesterase
MKPTAAPAWSTSLDVRVDVVRTSAGPIEVATTGEGPAVLLIHGIPGTWRQCVPLAEDLVGSKVILPSRPGYGRTPVRTGRTYAAQADAFAALLDTLGIARAGVVGLSGGAPIAIELAHRHPERVHGLVMGCAMAPHLITAPLSMRIVKVPGVAPVVSALVRAIGRRRAKDPAFVDAEIEKALTAQELARAKADSRIKDDLLRHELGHMAAPSGIHGLRNDILQIDQARRTDPPAYDVKCPTLLLHGDTDTVIPIDHGRFYASILDDAEFVTFENAGHVFALTRRTESSAAIKTFLEATRQR